MFQGEARSVISRSDLIDPALCRAVYLITLSSLEMFPSRRSEGPLRAARRSAHIEQRESASGVLRQRVNHQRGNADRRVAGRHF